LAVVGIFAVGGSGESPWWWLIIPGAAGVVYGLQRLFGKSPRPEDLRPSRLVGARFLVGAPWWQQAIYVAIIGGGSLYHLLESDYDGWYWWFLPAVAGLVFAKVVVTRKSLG
jgi:hypothetical protein